MSFLIAIALSACTSDKKAGCTLDGDCNVGFECSGSVCKCKNDQACGEGFICNTQRSCQKRSDCRNNQDCDLNKFCDLKSGACIERIACGQDLHCLPGQVCNQTTQRCADGCMDTADCPLYQSCQQGQCSTRCDDKTFCAYGSVCTNGACARDPNPNHCRDCQRDDDCGTGNNFCLINPSYDPGNPSAGSEFYCGIECDLMLQNCPNGYACGPIVLLIGEQCTDNAQCGDPARFCAIGEGELRGFCTCANDDHCNTFPGYCVKTCNGIIGGTVCGQNSDCLSNNCRESFCQTPLGQPCSADDQCAPTPNQCNGFCPGTGKPCSNDAECHLTCRDGGCLVGSACGPLEGLNCPDVTR